MSESPTLLKKQAHERFRAGRTAEAEALLRRAHGLDSRDTQILHNLGGLCLLKEDSSEALAWFQAALAVDPGLVIARLGLAKAQLKTRAPDAALATLASVSDDPATDAERGRLRGIALAQSGRAAEARAELEKVMTLPGGDGPETLRLLAELHHGGGDESALAPVLERLAAHQPTAYPVHARLAQALLRVGDLAGLNHRLDRIETQWTTSPSALDFCAALYQESGQLALAVRTAARARARGLAIDAQNHPHLARADEWRA